MNHHTCHTCGDQIPNGQAHIRSVSFKQQAFCGFCMAVKQGDALLAELPAQRQPSALQMRLAAARRLSA